VNSGFERQKTVFRRTSKLIVQLLGGLVAAAAIIVVAAAWRFAQGPLSLAPLTPYLQDSLNIVGAGAFQVRVRDTVLSWRGLDRGLDISVLDVLVVDPDGRPIARIPEMAVRFDLAELLQADLIPASIDIVGATIRVTRQADGAFVFGLGETQHEGSEWLARLERDLLLPPERKALATALREIAIRDADVAFVDEQNGVVWRLPSASLFLERSQSGLSGRLSANAAVSGTQVPLDLAARFDYVERTTAATLRFRGLSPTLLTSYLPEIDLLRRVQVPVDGTITTRVAAGTWPSDVQFRLTLGAGDIDASPYHDRPLPITRATLEGSVNLPSESVNLSDFTVEAGGATVAGAGALLKGERGSELAVSGNFRGFSAGALQQYWPKIVAPEAKDWFVRNVRSGAIDQGTYRITLSAGELAGAPVSDQAIDVRFAYRGTAATFLAGLPPVEGAQGEGRITGKSLLLGLDAGRIGGIALSEGNIRLSKDGVADWTAAIEFVASGRNSDVLGLLDSRPLALISRHGGFDPKTVEGLSATRARLRFPLRSPILAAQVQFAAAANLRDTAVRGLIPGTTLSKGTFALELTARALQLEGSAEVEGIPARVSWVERFDAEPQEASTRFTLTAPLGENDRRRLGIDFAPTLQGEVPTAVVVTAKDRQLREVAVEVDLTPAVLDVPLLAWRKARGAEGKVTFRARPDRDDVVLIEDLDIATVDLKAAGNLRLDAARKIDRLNLSRLVVGATDVAVAAEREQSGYRVSLTGASLDISTALDRLMDSGDPGGPSHVTRLKLARIKLDDERFITQVDGEVSQTDGALDSLRFAGSLNDEAPVTVAIAKAVDGKRRLTMASANAGRLARTLGFFIHADGGTFLANGLLDDTAEGWMIDGRVEVENLRVNNMPALTRVLSLASLTGILEVMSGEGIQFVRADVPFRFGRDKAEINGGRAFGPSLGITLDGTVDRRTDQLTFNGTLVPAYTINSVLGQIPLIGNLLVGRPGEGIIALNYSVRGTFEEPTISVNPLSALAPGFLRNFFTIFTNPPGRSGSQPQTIETRQDPPG